MTLGYRSTREPSLSTRAQSDGRTQTDGAARAPSPVWRRLLWIASYYAILGAIVAVSWNRWPAIRSLVESEEMHELAQTGGPKDIGAAVSAGIAAPWRPGTSTLLALTGALLTALPVAWVYALTRRRRGYDQSIAQTLVLLPLAVAGTVMLIQNSLALAFGLTGIVAMLRFRNTLEDAKDGVYIFIAMSIGISAAVGVLVVGIATSMVFNAVVVVLWWMDFARKPKKGRRDSMIPPSPVAERKRSAVELR